MLAQYRGNTNISSNPTDMFATVYHNLQEKCKSFHQHRVATCNVQNEDEAFNITDSTILTSTYCVTYETGLSHTAGWHILNE